MINNIGATTNSGGYRVLADATLSLGGADQSLTGNIVGTGEGTIKLVTEVSLDGTLSIPDGILSLPANGALTLNAGSTANVDTLDLSAGKLIGPGNLTANTINWSAGEMSGGGSTTAAAALNFTGSAILTLNGRTLNNAGDAVWNRTTPGYLNLQTTASGFNNQAGATFTIQDSELSFILGAGTFNNAGTLTKSGPVTDVQLSCPFVNAGTGIVEVESGRLIINNSSSAPASSGDYHILSGATLRLTGGAHNLTGDIAVTGQGTIEVAAMVNLDGTLTSPGALSLFSGGTLNLSTVSTTADVGILNLALGSLTGPGNLTAGTINWSAGTMSGSGSTTASSATNFTGTGNITLNGRTFNNAGAATWTRTGAGYLYFQTAATKFNNQSGATFTVQSSGQAIIFLGNGEFNNAGTLNLTTGEFRIHTFTQSSGGITNLAISGVTPFTNYSRFVTTHVELAGELNVSFTGGYTPQIGDLYILVTYSSDRTGDYSPVNVQAVDDIIWMRYYQKNGLGLLAAKNLLMLPIVLK